MEIGLFGAAWNCSGEIPSEILNQIIKILILLKVLELLESSLEVLD